MHYKSDKQGKSVLPVLMHGDALAGQGIVFESMQFSEQAISRLGVSTYHSIARFCNTQ